MRTMATQSEGKKQQMPNFTEAELETLVHGYEARRTAIDAKGDGPHGSAAKQRAWLQITKDLYAISGVRRDVADVKKKWADYKSIHKSEVRHPFSFLTAREIREISCCDMIVRHTLEKPTISNSVAL